MSLASELHIPAFSDHDHPSVSPLTAALEAAQVSFIQPLSFFVSWQGVLTLAYNGWPAGLLDLKKGIEATAPVLPPELAGSKWPKTSIGCLNDGRTLTPDQFHQLNALCKKFSAEQFVGDTPPQIAVDCAGVAVYQCRSLERLLFFSVVPFNGGHDGEAPDPAEQARMRALVAEADTPDYYTAVAREGNRRSHYCSNALGATLVHPLAILSGSSSPKRGGAPRSPRAGLLERGMAELSDRRRMMAAIEGFREQVERALPGMYHWFEERSLHVTLRGIIN